MAVGMLAVEMMAIRDGADTFIWSDALWNMQNEGILCDVLLQGCESNAVYIPAHRLVLSARSPYFRAMFSSAMQESRQDHVQLHNIPTKTLNMIVKYIYTSEVCIDDDNVVPLVKAAIFTDLPFLAKTCWNFLERNTDRDNCAVVYGMAARHQRTHLAAIAKTEVLRHFTTVAQTVEFLQLEKDMVMAVLGSDDILVESEDVVLDAAFSWIRHDPDQRASLLASLLSVVRLSHVHPEYLQSSVAEFTGRMQHHSGADLLMQIQQSVQAASSVDIRSRGLCPSPVVIERSGANGSGVPSERLRMLHSSYRDHGYRRPVISWNAVDVMGKEGLLQHGTIIATKPGGVRVDFGCANQRSALVPFGAAFSYTKRYDSLYQPQPAPGELQPGCSVDVLICVEPQGPWLWHPATLLVPRIPYEIELVYVEVRLGGIVRRVVVKYEQVRLPSTLVDQQSRIFNKDDFRLCNVRTPAHVTELLPTTTKLWKIFCQKLMSYQLSMISITKRGMLLLARSDNCPETQSRWDSLIRDAHNSIYRRIWKVGTVLDQELSCCLPFQLDWIQESVAGTEWTMHDVKHDILKETFKYLDTVEKTLCRRVCPVFDALISQVVSGELWVTCHRHCCKLCCKCSRYLDTYHFAASILKCSTSQTRTIILTHADSYNVSHLLLFIRMYAKLNICAMRQPVLIVASHCTVGRGDYGFQYQAEYLADHLAGGCYRGLLLHRCIVEAFLPERRFTGSLPVSCGNGDLYHLMESQVPANDVQRAAEWIAQSMHLQSADRTTIVSVLNEINLSDPRGTNPYRGHEWTMDNLAALDVTKLSSLALCFLSDFAPPNLFEELANDF